jgi:ferredoxin
MSGELKGNNMSKEEYDENLLRVNVKKNAVEPRRKNLGKEITDNLPTIEVDGTALDLFSNVEPLTQGPDMAGSLLEFLATLEYRKMAKRDKLSLYMWGDDENWGMFRQILEMIGGQHPTEQSVSGDRESDLAVLKDEIKNFAAGLDLLCGVTKVDRRFIANAADEQFPYDTAVVLGKAMDRDLIEEIPDPQEKLWDFETYIKLGKRVFDCAEFVRSKGYRAFARAALDGTVKYPPHAIMAGLGELGAGGWVITRQYGPWVRWTMLSVDADLEPDDPVDLHMGEYCEACRRCIKACPGNAITKEKIWYRGVYKRKVDTKKCFPFFEKHDGCGICLKVCPIGRFGYEKCMEAFRQDGTIPGEIV